MLEVFALTTVIALIWGMRERRIKNRYFSRLQALNFKEAELERLAAEAAAGGGG